VPLNSPVQPSRCASLCVLCRWCASASISSSSWWCASPSTYVSAKFCVLLHPPMFNHPGAPLSAFHPGAFHSSRWFCCRASLYIASRCCSFIQVVLLLRLSLRCIQVLLVHPGGFVVAPLSPLHPCAFHPSRWFGYPSLCISSRCFLIHPVGLVLHFIHPLFIHPSGLVAPLCVFRLSSFHSSRWFACASLYVSSIQVVWLCVSSTCFSSIQWFGCAFIQVFHPSSWWVLGFIQVLFIRPGGGFCVSSRCCSSIQVVCSTFHPSSFHPFRWWVVSFIHLLFIHPGGGLCVSSRCFSFVQGVGCAFHPGTFSFVQGVGFAFHPGVFHPSRWWVPRFIQFLFIRPGGGFCVSSIFFSSIQVVQLRLSLRFIQVLFIHPGGRFYVSSIQVVGSTFHPSRWFSFASLCVTSILFPSIEVGTCPIWFCVYIQCLSIHLSGSALPPFSFHPGGSVAPLFALQAFFHPFCVTSILFPFTQVVAVQSSSPFTSRCFASIHPCLCNPWVAGWVHAFHPSRIHVVLRSRCLGGFFFGWVCNLVLRLHPGGLPPGIHACAIFQPSMGGCAIWFCVYIQASMLVQSMGGSKKQKKGFCVYIQACMLVQFMGRSKQQKKGGARVLRLHPGIRACAIHGWVHPGIQACAIFQPSMGGCVIWFCVYIQVVWSRYPWLCMGGSENQKKGFCVDIKVVWSKHPCLCNPWVGRRNKKKGSVFTSKHPCLYNPWVGPSNKKTGVREDSSSPTLLSS